MNCSSRYPAIHISQEELQDKGANMSANLFPIRIDDSALLHLVTWVAGSCKQSSKKTLESKKLARESRVCEVAFRNTGDCWGLSKVPCPERGEMPRVLSQRIR